MATWFMKPMVREEIPSSVYLCGENLIIIILQRYCWTKIKIRPTRWYGKSPSVLSQAVQDFRWNHDEHFTKLWGSSSYRHHHNDLQQPILSQDLWGFCWPIMKKDLKETTCLLTMIYLATTNNVRQHTTIQYTLLILVSCFANKKHIQA